VICTLRSFEDVLLHERSIVGEGSCGVGVGMGVGLVVGIVVGEGVGIGVGVGSVAGPSM
jgi:hypothetical protein